MSTTLIQRNLWRKLQGKKYRHSFVSSQIGANVAAQIASTRVARGWTQKELAKRAKMSQVRISVLEDPNYENFSVKTLKRLAEAFDTALILKFAPFSEMLGWLTTLSPEHLAVKKFEEDLPAVASSELPKHEQPIPMELYPGHASDRLQTRSEKGALQGSDSGTTILNYGSDYGSDYGSSFHPKADSAQGQMMTGSLSRRSLTRENKAVQFASVGEL